MLILLSKDLIEQEILQKKECEVNVNKDEKEKQNCETDMDNKEKTEKIGEKNAEEGKINTKENEKNESENKSERIQEENRSPKCDISTDADNLPINSKPTLKPKIKKTVTFELVEEKEKGNEETETQMKSDIVSAIATIDADIENKKKERIDDAYINFPSSQLDSIIEKRSKYVVATEDISDDNEKKDTISEDKKEEQNVNSSAVPENKEDKTVDTQIEKDESVLRAEHMPKDTENENNGKNDAQSCKKESDTKIIDSTEPKITEQNTEETEKKDEKEETENVNSDGHTEQLATEHTVPVDGHSDDKCEVAELIYTER